MYVTRHSVVNTRVTPREFHLTVGESEVFVAVRGLHPIKRL